MTPTPMPRDWNRVDAALAGVIAFPEVDRLVARVTASLPLKAEDARQLQADAPRHRSEAARRQVQARNLRDLSEKAVRAAQEEHSEARAECHRLRRRVFWLRVRLAWLRFIRPVLGAVWWLLTALPRLFRWLARLAARPFRRRAPDRFRGGDDDFGPRRRFR